MNEYPNSQQENNNANTYFLFLEMNDKNPFFESITVILLLKNVCGNLIWYFGLVDSYLII